MAEKEFIEREKIINGLELSIASWSRDCNSSAPIMANAYRDMLSRVKKYPAADVVEVKHARFEWGYQNKQYGIWCTHCGAGWVNSENAEWIAKEHNYCPNCGADIRGVDNG